MKKVRPTPSMTATPSPVTRGYLFIIIAVFFWGGSASLAKFLFTTRFDTIILTQTRSSLSFVLIVLWFAVRDRSVFRIDRKDVIKFLLAGVIGISITNYSYYFTIKQSTVATAIIVQYTAPVLVMVYAVAIAREETLNGAKVLALLLSLAGCYLTVSGGDMSSIRLGGWSLVSGITSSLSYAFMLLMSKHLLRRYSVWTMLTYAFGFSMVFWLFVNNPWEIAAKGYTVADWGVLWIFAVFSVLIPHTMFVSGLKLLDASTVGIVTTLEPVIAIVTAYFALGESLGVVQILGALAVVSAVVLLQLRQMRNLLFQKDAIHAG